MQTSTLKSYLSSWHFMTIAEERSIPFNYLEIIGVHKCETLRRTMQHCIMKNSELSLKSRMFYNEAFEQRKEIGDGDFKDFIIQFAMFIHAFEHKEQIGDVQFNANYEFIHSPTGNLDDIQRDIAEKFAPHWDTYLHMKYRDTMSDITFEDYDFEDAGVYQSLEHLNRTIEPQEEVHQIEPHPVVEIHPVEQLNVHYYWQPIHYACPIPVFHHIQLPQKRNRSNSHSFACTYCRSRLHQMNKCPHAKTVHSLFDTMKEIANIQALEELLRAEFYQARLDSVVKLRRQNDIRKKISSSCLC